MDLPNPIGSEKSVSLAHLELGEYQLFINLLKQKKKLRAPILFRNVKVDGDTRYQISIL